MLDEQGGVIDDLIIYYLADDWFRIVVNAATRDKDMAWIERQAAAFDIEVRERSDLSMVAVQGPNARDKALGLIAEDDRARVGKPGKFAGIEAKADDGASLFVARTGYTGADGFEIVLPQDRAVALWDALLSAGVKPAGLGARDPLRLEAGLNLYGQEMDETVPPRERKRTRLKSSHKWANRMLSTA